MGKTLAILTNGGDCPSLNAIIYYLREIAAEENFDTVFGFQGGYIGLITDDIIDLRKGRCHIDPHTGGSFLRALRGSPVPNPEERQKLNEEKRKEYDKKYRVWTQAALNTLKRRKIDVLIVIGGDGTAAATRGFIPYIEAEEGCNTKIIFFPRTIDGDLWTDTDGYTGNGRIKVSADPGFFSALHKIKEATESLQSVAYSTRRAFTIETMGRNAGWLACGTVLGGADAVIIPEVDFLDDMIDGETIENRLYRKSAELYNVSNCLVVGVSEGTRFNGKQAMQLRYGKRKLGGAGDLIARGGRVDESDPESPVIVGLEAALKEKGVVTKFYPKGFEGKNEYAIELNPEVRCQHTDYEPRMGSPIPYDVELAKVLACRVRKMLRDGEFNRYPILRELVPLEGLSVELTESRPIEDALFFPLPEELYDKRELTTTDAFNNIYRDIV